jgi:vancomycin permeability regulator SanA
LLTAVILALLAASFILLVDGGVERSGRQRTADYARLPDLAAAGKFDCVIVPGALVHPDGHPSEMLKDRLNMAIRIFQDGYVDRVLVSGDHSQKEYDG